MTGPKDPRGGFTFCRPLASPKNARPRKKSIMTFTLPHNGRGRPLEPR